MCAREFSYPFTSPCKRTGARRASIYTCRSLKTAKELRKNKRKCNVRTKVFKSELVYTTFPLRCSSRHRGSVSPPLLFHTRLRLTPAVQIINNRFLINPLPRSGAKLKSIRIRVFFIRVHNKRERSSSTSLVPNNIFRTVNH